MFLIIVFNPQKNNSESPQCKKAEKDLFVNHVTFAGKLTFRFCKIKKK